MFVNPKTKRRRIGWLPTVVLAVLAVLALTPQVLAVDVTDVGVVDQAAIGQLRPFQDAQTQFGQYRQQLSAQFQSAVKNKSQAERQKIYQGFNARMASRQQQLFGPLLARTQNAIASVAANKNLCVVVDKQIVIVGGSDVTKDVISMLNQPGQVVPPVNTPPPCEVGVIDQQQIDALPKVKKANDDFLQFKQNLQGQLNQQLGGKSADQRQQIISSFNQQLVDEQNKVLKPIVDSTQKAIGDVAKHKNLLLVIDGTNRVYGGTDVTADVVKALQ